MFKHRLLLPGRKLTRGKRLRACGRSLLAYGIILNVLILLFLWLRLQRLSSLRDLGEARADELNEALRRLPIVDESRDRWTSPRVEGARILSAYLDTRPQVVLEEDSSLVRGDTAWAMIRIIGIIPSRMENASLTCHYRYRFRDSDESYVLRRRAIGARLAAVRENFGMLYCAAFLLCELPGRESVDRLNLPHEVSVSSASGVEDGPVEDGEYVVVRYPKMAVCVQPLHHRFDMALDLLAFVEFYRMMGVGRFTFYRDSVDPRVDRILDHYAREDVATVIDWPLSKYYDFERNLRVDGIFAALNDCLYRSAFHDSYRYVAGVDTDEYIVPRKHEDIASMMDYLNDSDAVARLTGAWIFRNMFFYLMHVDDPSPLKPGLPQLKIHTKTMRWQEINPPRDRSKFIVQGRDVIDMGNHQIWKLKRAWSLFGTRYEEVVVDPETAGSHHYRKCETTVETCWQRRTTLDRAAHRFTPKLAERVANVSRAIFPLDSLWSQ